MFVNTTDLGNSVLIENAEKIGLGTTSPVNFFQVKFLDTTGFTGYAVRNLGSAGSTIRGWQN